MKKEETSAASPLPSSTGKDKNVGLSFYLALQALAKGGKITKLEWENENVYGLMHNGLVTLHKDDDKLYSWLISDGDINGTDWVIIDEK
jgi:hypothetical protein